MINIKELVTKRDMKTRTVIIVLILITGLFLVSCSNEESAEIPMVDTSEATIPTELPATATIEPTVENTPLPQPTETSIPLCSEQSRELRDTLDTQLDIWEDTIALADQTARINLGDPIADLQSIKRDVANTKAPECAYIPHKLTIDYMDYSIQGFLDFMGQKPSNIVDEQFELANLSLRLSIASWDIIDTMNSGISYIVISDMDPIQVIYTIESGETVQEEITTPWSATLDIEKGSPVELKAWRGSRKPIITCIIMENGVELASDTVNGGTCMVASE